MRRKLLLACSYFAFTLLACSITTGLPGTATSVPPTLAPTPVESAFAPPTNPTAAPPTSLPTITPNIPATQPPTLPNLPPEAILILSPGSGSQIAGPITVSGVANSTFENNLVVEVRDVNGNVIGLTPTTINADLGGRGPFEVAVEFTSPAQEAPGRIVVYDTSARDGHIIHLSSVVVTLLPSGAVSDVKPGREHPEDIIIYSPALLDVVSGGIAHISGFSASTFEQNLQLAVLDENGVVAGSSFTTIQTSMGEPGPFEGDVPYSVTSEQPGSVQVYATSPLDGSIEHLASVEVKLKP